MIARWLTVALLVSAAPAFAQTYSVECLANGNNAPEAVGDREGHAIVVSGGTCNVYGGLLDGAVQTQSLVWEVDKGIWTLLNGVNVIRKPGSMAVVRFESGTLTPHMQDGRMVSFTAAQKGQIAFASGGASQYSGKRLSTAVQSQSAGRWKAEATFD